MTKSLQQVQVEFLRPQELRAAMSERPLVYLPLGSYEWHAEHLPIGLDALTAHGVCLRAAVSAGGIVCPPIYYGVGGGHVSYPWTVMLESEVDLRTILERSLVKLQDFGVERTVIFTGHFSDEQLLMISQIADAWNMSTRSMHVLALAINMSGSAIAPDHAGVFETTLLSALWPDRVDLGALPPLRDAPSIDPNGDVVGEHRHDPNHPLYGVFGPDPRTADLRNADLLLDSVVNWLVNAVASTT